MKKKIIYLFTIALIALIAVTGCSNGNQNNPTNSATATNSASNMPTATATAKEKINIKIGGLKGPTGIGMANLMQAAENGETPDNYEFELFASPNDITGLIIKGELDICAVPTNVASVLYNKTQGNIQLLSLNTLGVLYVLEKGNSINSISDLKGKTIYATGQASTPEYAIKYILTQNNIDPDKDVEIIYEAEHAALATKALSGSADIIILPEPFVTTVLSKSSDFKIALSINDEWNKASNNASIFSMGALIVRRDFAQQNKDAVNAFLEEYAKSAQKATSDISQTAALTVKYGIIASEEYAVKAIPNCNIVYIDGDEMKTKTNEYLKLLYNFDPSSIGGSIPNEDFYYQK